MLKQVARSTQICSPYLLLFPSCLFSYFAYLLFPSSIHQNRCFKQRRQNLLINRAMLVIHRQILIFAFVDIGLWTLTCSPTSFLAASLTLWPSSSFPSPPLLSPSLPSSHPLSSLLLSSHPLSYLLIIRYNLLQ